MSQPTGVPSALRRLRAAAAALLIVTLSVVPAGAAAPEDRILGLDRYTSDKGRALASAYARDLRELNSRIYNCMPWVEVPREGIGFFKPKDVPGDDRYLSLHIYIEQDASPAFAGMRMEERASSMFSRYVGPLLQRMTANPALVRDASLDGFTLILEWQKGPAAGNDRPVHETIAVFVEKPLATDYLTGVVPVGELVQRARVYGWDGETKLGRLRLTAWNDDFVTTFKVANYQPDPGVRCP